MKWLSITWYKVLPARFGGQRGIASFNQELGKLGEGVCLCSSDNIPESGLSYKLLPQLIPGKKQFLLPHSRKIIRRVCAQEKPDILLLEHPYYGGAARKAAKEAGAKLVLHAHNIEADRFRETGRKSWRWVRRVERKTMEAASLIIFKTDKDCERAQDLYKIVPGKTLVLPYGIEKHDPPATARLQIREEYGISAEEKVFLFPATLDYEPNAEAMVAIYEKLVPELEATGVPCRIIICGRNHIKQFRYLDKLNHPMVIRAGEVSDTDPYFSAADCLLNPVLSGGGIQTKNLEALSWHCPVTSFAFGMQGIDLSVCGDMVTMVPDHNWPLFAQKLIVSARGPQTPERFFETYRISRLAEILYERLKTV